MLIQGDALHIPLASRSVHCVVTSPPYWGLREYAGLVEWRGGDPNCPHEDLNNSNKGNWTTHPGRFPTCSRCGASREAAGIGLEATPEDYLASIVTVGRELRRVLRDDGAWWLNVGDCYAAEPKGSFVGQDRSGLTSTRTQENGPVGIDKRGEMAEGNLLLMPHRVALALQADGWIVRQDVIWSKVNPMPESVNGTRWERHLVKAANRGRGREDWRSGTYSHRPQQDHDGRDFRPDAVWRECPGCKKCSPHGGYILRPGSWRHTRAHEYLFLLTKQMRYFADAETVREAAQYGRREWTSVGGNMASVGGGRGNATVRGANPSYGRNPRSVIHIPTAPYRGAHYATFPPALIAPLIMATCPRWCCPVCGAGWAPAVEQQRASGDGTGQTDCLADETAAVGYRPTCEHEHGLAEAVPGVVLDPFVGSGTTVMVARQLLRRGVGIDLSWPYLEEQARIRTGLGGRANFDALPLFASGQQHRGG